MDGTRMPGLRRELAEARRLLADPYPDTHAVPLPPAPACPQGRDVRLADPRVRATDRLPRRVEAFAAERGTRVALGGHSRGGHLARFAAIHPDGWSNAQLVACGAGV
jgi:hypothetical protein